MPYNRIPVQDESSINNDRNNRPLYSPASTEGVNLLLSHQVVEGPASDETFEVLGFKHNQLLSILYNFYGVVTFGFIYLLVHWKPEWELYLRKKKSSLLAADTLLLKDAEGYNHVVEVKTLHLYNASHQDLVPNEFTADRSPVKRGYGTRNEHEKLADSEVHRYVKYFIFQYMKYVWNFKNRKFECLIGLGKDCSIGSIFNDFRGYSQEERQERLLFYGKNCITIEVKSYWNLLFMEVLNPFYIFQVFAIILWAFDSYLLYGLCILIISCLSIGVSLYETRKQSESLRNMVEACNASSVYVRDTTEGGQPMEIDAMCLVPGDVIVIPSHGCVMACDAVLISGNAIVNESMLTGITVMDTFHWKVLAVVVRTGFSTAKGELVRSILYPRPMDFKFYNDSMTFICLLFVVAVIGMSFSLYLHISRNKPVITTVVRTLDIVTIVVPPALPAAMTVGTYYAQNRLKRLGIFCISPPRINICGKLKLVCFDKTGTLTEDGLEVWGAIRVERPPGTEDLCLSQPLPRVELLNPRDPLTVGLASCHSLTYINGEMIGDPLDLQMFKATKWSLVEPAQDSECYENLIPTLVRPPFPFLTPGWDFSCDLKLINNKSSDQVILSKDSLDSPLSGKQPQNVNPSHTVDLNIEGKGHSQEKSDTLTLGQIMQEMSDGVVPTIVKPCTSDTYVDPPTFSNIQETSFEVPYEVGIVRQFPFSSSVQRMSVIVRVLGSDHMDLYTKGAPEVVQMMCAPNTVPQNFADVLTRFTVQGFRVIALAHRRLPPKLSWHNAQRIRREEVENEMTFIGLLILQNVLKPETTPVINQLKSANIRTVMVTGDNILTGVCVARDCGMVDKNEKVLLANVVSEDGKRSLVFELAHSGGLADSVISPQEKVFTSIPIESNRRYHLAISGGIWSQIKEYFPQYVPYIVSQGTVFARMSPEQKVQLVEELQKLQYVVAMCGDGANDCGALKAAHVGISLSEAEASVAAPFTSRTPNITCVPHVICEGRCALTTNFSIFKYMAVYSMIQFVSVLILYYACTNLSDKMFLYIDLFIVTSVAIFMGYTKANHTLVAKRPLSSLIGAVNLYSVMSQVTLVIAVQVMAFLYLASQPWYIPQKECSRVDSDVIVDTWETNVIFCISSFQYLAVAVIFSPGSPFRKPLYTNKWLLVTLIILTANTIWLTIYPTKIVAEFMKLKEFPEKGRYMFHGMLLIFATFHFALGWFNEYCVAGSTRLKKFFQFVMSKREPKNLYKRVEKTIVTDSTWPPYTKDAIYSSVT